MEYWRALVEWESGGLDDVHTENILEFMQSLVTELNKRQEQDINTCAVLTIREQLEPKIDILFSGVNKLPVGVYNLIPIKKEE